MERIITIVSLILLTIETVELYCIYRDKQKETREKKIRAYKEERRIQSLISYFIHQVELAENLDDVFLIHIRIWGSGIRHPNFGPDEFGVFRTDDIMTMQKEQVFLGSINGLWTNMLPKWRNTPDEPVVLEQYKRILISNLKTMQN